MHKENLKHSDNVYKDLIFVFECWDSWFFMTFFDMFLWLCYSLSVEKYPDNRMLGTRELVNGKHGPYVWLTYKQVYDKVIQDGNVIRACGVEPVSELFCY
ncbi:putative long-chain-fatty-acid--CoA ligase, CDP-diacylglycerol--inositol 3-phosphatidyltransferase [Helianthus annuus]|nr:putative long-chain-fatty-acid--CoA ligase, CDP-diacylglycerol--inositol 3-phosphatidyltransferase [Helianthus annuus]KAJ0782033.1 putative long-chain-fatty-acid--CoA ligase, CDP-diacylglycerol--inositol 3-phosphatidyltransferase [Helianthus annuus]